MDIIFLILGVIIVVELIVVIALLSGIAKAFQLFFLRRLSNFTKKKQ